MWLRTAKDIKSGVNMSLFVCWAQEQAEAASVLDSMC